MNKKVLHKTIIPVFVIFCLAIVFSIFFSPYIFQLENVYEYDQNVTRISIHVKDEIPKGSFAKEMRIVNMKINNDVVSLEKYDNAGWTWHEEWGYTLYTDSDEEFVIDYKEPIKNLSFEYVKHQGSGIAEIYVGNTKIDEINMYKSRWYNFEKYYTFVTPLEKNLKFVEHTMFFIIIFFAVFIVLRNIMDKNEKRKYGVSSSLGMFDAAKGLSMFLIILGHSITDPSKSATSILLLMLAYIVAIGLMPMFYIISGYGFRGEKNVSCMKKQLSFLLKPYLVLAVATILCSLIKMAIMSEYTMQDVKSLVVSFLTFSTIGGTIGGVETISVGPIWFCIELCIAWIILNLIFSLKNKKAIYISLAILMIVGVLSERLPYNIYGRTQFIPAVFFIFVGYLLRDKKLFQKENKYTCLKYVAVVIVAVLVIMINGVVVAASNYMGRYYVLGVLSAASMGVVLLRLYMILNSKVNMKLFKKIGRNTYDIIYIHNFEYLVVPWDKIMNYVDLPMIVEGLLVTVLRCILIYLIFKIVQLFRKMIRKSKVHRAEIMD